MHAHMWLDGWQDIDVEEESDDDHDDESLESQVQMLENIYVQFGYRSNYFIKCW